MSFCYSPKRIISSMNANVPFRDKYLPTQLFNEKNEGGILK